MTRKERSAGVVAFVLDDAGGRVYLLLDYGRQWDFPKGHVEKGEDDRAAAIRELAEETGIAGERLIEGFAHEITYFFRDRRTKNLVRKSVVFFLAQLSSREVVLSDEHVGFEFLPYEQAQKKLTFPAARELLRLANEFLSNPASDKLS
jgi:8-oxo-dGTP pyrophosphatase MutT (NUDIX family)